jgi:hypothetical protein
VDGPCSKVSFIENLTERKPSTHEENEERALPLPRLEGKLVSHFYQELKI